VSNAAYDCYSGPRLASGENQNKKTTQKLNMKKRFPIIITRLLSPGLVALAFFVSGGQNTLAAQTPADPTHAAHVASGAMPPDAATSDPALSQQISELQAKVAQLEAALAQSAPLMAAAPAGAAMPGMPAAAASATPPMRMGMDKMKTAGGMPGMSPSAAPAQPMAGMSNAAAPAAGMMGMMDKMMGMMDKMMSMGGASAPMPSGGGMGMDKMKIGAGGSMPPAPATGMSGGGGIDQMELAGMMGMGPMGAAAGAMPESALPGFPGSSHLYHIGATDFFLDHPQHIALTTQQQAGLNKAKEQALLAKSTADRAVEQAEQELWTLTAADQPDATAIQAKIAAIGKLTGDERLAFIRAVGDASKILTDEQRRSLTGFAPPAPAAAMPAGAMKDM
jgi:Spy/CpxP family protein refolding chaperone